MGELSELTVAILRFGFLAVLWLFVLIALSVMRRDLFRSAARQPAAGRSAPAGPVAEESRGRGRRGSGRPRQPSALVVLEGSQAGRSVALGSQPITIGRSQDCTLPLQDQYASTQHARLVPRDGQWFVEDLGSTNGTYLDRAKVSGALPVPVGAPLRIGKTVMELRA